MSLERACVLCFNDENRERVALYVSNYETPNGSPSLSSETMTSTEDILREHPCRMRRTHTCESCMITSEMLSLFIYNRVYIVHARAMYFDDAFTVQEHNIRM